MKESFKILRITRNNILNAIKDLSVEQLNKIPEGYNNNIIWNVAHNCVTMQLLVYKLSGVEPKISAEFIDQFKKGTSPIKHYDENEINQIKELLINTINWLEEDYSKELFNTYNEYTTSYNITLSSTEDAILFNNVHEGLHFGYIMALKRAL